MLPEFPDQGRQPLGPDPHLDLILLHVDALDDELDDASLLGGEQLGPDRGELGEQDGDLELNPILRNRELVAVAQVVSEDMAAPKRAGAGGAAFRLKIAAGPSSSTTA